MKSIAETLLRVCLFLAITSLGLFVLIGAAEIAVSSDGVVKDAHWLGICGLLFVFAIAIGLCGAVLDAWSDHRATKAARIERAKDVARRGGL